jgi:hypothetical protein
MIKIICNLIRRTFKRREDNTRSHTDRHFRKSPQRWYEADDMTPVTRVFAANQTGVAHGKVVPVHDGKSMWIKRFQFRS